MSEALSHAIDEIERYPLTDVSAVVAKALAVMKALKYVLDGPRPTGIEQALAELDVSALVDEQGWPQIRYTLALKGGRA
jgi:hypothetical protein